MIRQHQFDKVELVKFTRAETSYDDAREAHARRRDVLERLELPYRRVAPLPRRPGFRVREDVRPRGLAARAERVQGDLLLLELRGLPGAPRRDPREGRRPGREVAERARPHAERLGPRRRADARRDPRELPAGGRLRRDPEGPPALLRRPHGDPQSPDGARAGGGGGIRTPGTFRYNGFQDRRLKPLGHSSARRVILAARLSTLPARLRGPALTTDRWVSGLNQRFAKPP